MMKRIFLLGCLSLVSASLVGCSGKTVAKDESSQAANKEAAIDENAEAGKPAGDEAAASAKAQAAAADSQPKDQGDSGAEKELYKKFLEARQTHSVAQANQLAGEILSRNPNDTKVMNALASMAIEQEKYDLARLLINKILSKDPTNSGAYNNLGVVELKTDNLRLALVQFKKATELDLGNRAAHANLGAIYLQYRNYQNAAQELNAAVEHGDQTPATLSNLGFAMAGTGDYANAGKYYEKALAKEPNNVSIMLNYATLLVEHTNHPKDGIKLLNKIRFVAREPVILGKVDGLMKRAESPTPSPAKGVSE